ncbi:hypothetical protein [Rhodococcus phage RGL3]|uniref:Uncharacterized protein n=1 Tax=Rhodococcus phage RGL3 TaxID=2922221 RepID=G9FHP5_9CAUD|nr:hypothetical protein RoPhRGL3_gp53 [Rhodococcus phage RGL3]AEV52133.1 hypothetical protein [Rhodococcus phage RGL3]
MTITDNRPQLAQDLALSTFLETFCDGYTAHDLGAHLTCSETDAYADLMISFGYPHAAEAVTRGHLDEESWACEGLDDGDHVPLARFEGPEELVGHRIEFNDVQFWVLSCSPEGVLSVKDMKGMTGELNFTTDEMNKLHVFGL